MRAWRFWMAMAGCGVIATACASGGLTPSDDAADDGADHGAEVQARGLGGIANGRPAWSPDGGLIAFETTRTGNREIFVMNPDGSNKRNCTQMPGADHWPVWSPDGTKILFQSARSGNDELYAIGFDPGSGQCAGQPANLTNAPSHERPGDWGSGLIAFSTTRDGNLEVYLMKEDGTNPTNCSRWKGSDHYGAISPDGGTLAIHSHRNLHPKLGNGEIWFIPVSTSGDGSPSCGSATRFTVNDHNDENPDWNPDGTKLVVHRNVGPLPQDPATDNWEIVVIDVSTKAEQRLTNTEAGIHDVHPAWSPDGSTIAFASNRSGTFHVWVMNPDGTGLDNLTD